MKRIVLWLLMIVVAISAIGCGGKASSEKADFFSQTSSVSRNGISATGGVQGETSPELQSQAKNNDTFGGDQAASEGAPRMVPEAGAGQKVIFSGQINFETLDFDKTSTELMNYISSAGGYQQSSSVHGGRIGQSSLRSAEYVFRIPKTGYMQAFSDLKQFGTVVFEQSNGEDITEQYFDTEARLKALKVRQERLLALLEKADKMEDILKIEKELQEALYEIENYTGTLKKWDSLVEYATLSVNVREVAEIKPELKENDGLLTRIIFGFKNSIRSVWDFIQDMIVFLAQALPVLIPLGAIGYLLYRLIRRNAKKTKIKSKRTEPEKQKIEPGNQKEETESAEDAGHKTEHSE